MNSSPKGFRPPTLPARRHRDNDEKFAAGVLAVAATTA
jgi:hypothetical protein